MKEIILVLFNRALGRILKLGQARFKSTFQAGICFGISLGLSLSASTAFSPARGAKLLIIITTLACLVLMYLISHNPFSPKIALAIIALQLVVARLPTTFLGG